MADKNGLYTSTVPAISERQKAIATKATAIPVAKVHLTSVPATLVRQCDPGSARGLELTRMRARSRGDTPHSASPPAMTRQEKILAFKRLEGGLSPAQREKARRILRLV